MEDDAGQIQEDGLVGVRVGDRRLRVTGEEHGGHDGHQRGAEHADDLPRHAVTAAGDGIGGGAQRHEAHDDVRLAEVAQAPRQRRDDPDDGGRGERVGQEREPIKARSRVGFGDEAPDLPRAAECDHSDYRHRDQGNRHHEALDEVGEAHREEAAEERVGDRDGSDDQHADAVIGAEAGFHEHATGDHAGAHVEGEEGEDDHARSDAEEPRAVAEPVLQEAWDRDGVVRHLRVRAEPGRDKLPVAPRADRQADGDPCFDEPRRVDGAGQTHEQPTGHVRCPRRQRSDGRVQIAPSEHVVVEVLGPVIAVPADEQHGGHVGHHCGDLEGGVAHEVPFRPAHAIAIVAGHGALSAPAEFGQPSRCSEPGSQSSREPDSPAPPTLRSSLG